MVRSSKGPAWAGLASVLFLTALPAAAAGPDEATGNFFSHAPLPKNTMGLPAHSPNTVLVAFQPSVPRKDRYRLFEQLGLEVDKTALNPYFFRLRLSKEALGRGATVETTLKTLLVDERIRVAERDWIVTVQQTYPNDPRFSELWGLHNTGQTGGSVDADIDAPFAWANQTGSSSVKVAVIDTGIDYTHPDLAANCWTNPGEIPGNSIDDDNNGFVDDVYGYDFVNGDGNPMDDHSHGTHCAGTVGGVGNNGIGVVGVCWNVKMIGVKFLSAGGSGSTSDAILATDYARIVGANIMSNSWGGGGFSQLLLDAIVRAESAGILYVAAAGNSGSNLDSTTFYPASYLTNLSTGMAVGASTHNDTRAGFSSYGATTVHIFAPGENVLSTVPFALNASGYDVFSGTSMATPHVAGAAALLKSHFSGDSMAQIKSRLMNSAEAVPALAGLSLSGRLNVYNSMDNDTTPPGTPSGFVGIKRSAGTIRLQWVASGDDGNVGAASQYDLRVSSSPINAGNFASARRVTSVPAPEMAGTVQNGAANGLFPNRSYYFALKAFDNVGNASGIVTAGPYTTMSALLADDMEGAVNFTPQAGSLWALTTAQSTSPTRSWTDSPGGNYGNNVNAFLRLTAPVAITGPTIMRFMCKSSLERNYDYLYVEASTNGTTWNQLLRTDASFDWTPISVGLNDYIGQNVQIRFRLTTDGSVVYDGVYIDDLVFTGMTTFFTDNVEGGALFSGQAPWAITTEAFSSPTRSWTDSPGGDYGVDNLDISLTQNSSVAVPAVENPLVFFRMIYDLEPGYDYLTVYFSSDGGGSYQASTAFSGSNLTWSTYTAPLGSGATARVRFRMTTDYSVNDYDGVHIDDITFAGEPCEAIVSTRPISGTITLQDWLGAVPGVPIVVEVRAVGSTTPLETLPTTLGAGGTFTVQTALPTGNYDVAVKAPRWLRKVAGNRTLAGGGMTGVNLALPNGDEDGDNEIAIGDYSLLSANFGTGGPVGDINGDGEVDIADFAIMSANFGMLGDD